ncbi:MAG: enhanced entry protein EnhB [Legionella sp.]|nr:enhanced entry protein EnhB [Legionella sp.]
MSFSTFNKSLLLIILFISSFCAEAFPRGCEVRGFNYSQNFLELNEAASQSFYLIQNRSDVKIELERNETSNAFMNPPLHVAMDPMNWSAFASDEKVIFKCYQHITEGTSPVDCREVLDVCQYPRARFALSNMGNYWIASNQTQQNIINDAIKKGIYLKW